MKWNYKYDKNYGVSRHFQQYFNYIVVFSFINGGNREIDTDLP